MQYVTGMPEEDVPRAAELVRTMGAFVGSPFDVQKSKDCIAAQQEFSIMVRRWRERWAREHKNGTLTSDVLPYWMHHNIFETDSEFEANVVMILFAGTHNLENILAHVVRLLLLHPEQMSFIEENPELLPNAINEALRYCPAIRTLPRTALRDTELRLSRVAPTDQPAAEGPH